MRWHWVWVRFLPFLIYFVLMIKLPGSRFSTKNSPTCVCNFRFVMLELVLPLFLLIILLASIGTGLLWFLLGIFQLVIVLIGHITGLVEWIIERFEI